MAHPDDLATRLASSLGGGGPDRNPLDPVAGFLDGLLYSLLRSLSSFEGDSHHVPRRVDVNVGDMV
jgi:hypothetical protein